MTLLDRTKEFEFLESLTAELSSKELIFPTSLTATMKIRHALGDAKASAEKVARIISAEPVLCAQILRLANSAAFSGGANPSSDLHRAIVRLGFDTVRNVAIAIGMKQLIQSKSTADATRLVNGLWNRSIRVASLSFVLAKKLTRLSPDAALIAGLLHDIGKFYILSRLQSSKGIVVDQDALWDVVDRWHLNIGEAILENWDVPLEIRVAVLNHREVGREHFGPADLTDVIQAANILDAQRDPESELQIDWNALPTGFVLLNLDQESGQALIDEAKEEVELIFQSIA